MADAARPVRPPRRGTDLAPRQGWSLAPHPTSGLAPKPAHDFRVGIPDARLFPFDTWRRLVTAELRVGAHDLGTYADPAGHPPLREAIARQLALSRGVTATADEVLVTYGTQQALDLVTRVLVSPGDVVAVEEPGYPLARDVFASYGARVVPVRVDDEGLVVDELPSTARLVFTTPSHQFPYGPPLSLDRRRALLDFAGRHRCAVIEDDYDSEFRFTERPLETLHSMDDAGRVLYLGTFSKSLVPGLRFGYLVAPEPLQAGAAGRAPALGRLRRRAASRPRWPGSSGTGCSPGTCARPGRRTPSGGGWCSRGSTGRWLGTSTWCRARPGCTSPRCCATSRSTTPTWSRRAAEEGLVVEALSSYSRRRGSRAASCSGYGAADTESIRPGLARLREVLDATPSTPARRPR